MAMFQDLGGYKGWFDDSLLRVPPNANATYTCLISKKYEYLEINAFSLISLASSLCKFLVNVCINEIERRLGSSDFKIWECFSKGW